MLRTAETCNHPAEELSSSLFGLTGLLRRRRRLCTGPCARQGGIFADSNLQVCKVLSICTCYSLTRPSYLEL